MKLAQKYFTLKYGIEITNHTTFLLNKKIPIRKINTILFIVTNNLNRMTIEALIGIENTNKLYSL